MKLTAKERNLIKGAIRRVFSRSELRRSIIAASQIEHYDPSRPRVKKWGRCTACKQPTALYQLEVDHLDPIIPVNRTLEDMSWDEVIARVFCDPINLDTKCKLCHRSKSKVENRERALARKERKNNVKRD